MLHLKGWFFGRNVMVAGPVMVGFFVAFAVGALISVVLFIIAESKKLQKKLGGNWQLVDSAGFWSMLLVLIGILVTVLFFIVSFAFAASGVPGFVGEPSDEVVASERYVTVAGEPEINELGAVTLNVVTDTGQVESIRCGSILDKGLIATEHISFVRGNQMEATVFTIERSYPNPVVYSLFTDEVTGCEITMPDEWFDEFYVQQ